MSALCGFPDPDRLEAKGNPAACDVCEATQGSEYENTVNCDPVKVMAYPIDGKVYHLCNGCIYAAATYWPYIEQRKRAEERNAKRNARRRELRKERRQAAK